MVVFGPVPSRRLGRSLGINNIPPKICTYSCVYCQLGNTLRMRVKREAFYAPEQILKDVQNKIAKVKKAGETIDYLTFVPDGEPTLDVNLGREIDLLKSLGIKIAVITNSSLIWQEAVRQDLLKADWVSLKMDAVRQEVWRQVNRPHGKIELTAILDGALAFARAFEGELATETMLVAGVNDDDDHIGAVADFVARLSPSTAYLSIPTRPPAEAWVHPPAEPVINRVYQIFSERMAAHRQPPSVEYLIGYEGNAFAFTGDVEQDILSITSVHPMREDAVSDFLQRAGADWSVIHDLIAQERMIELQYDEKKFYMRKLG